MSNERQPYELVERNLRSAMAFYAGSNEKGETRTMAGVELVHCGWDYPVFNSALLSAPVAGVNGTLEARLAMASIYFRALGVGWSYWICHDLLDEATLRHMRDSCYTYRMEPVITAPGMYVQELLPPKRRALPLEVREVRDTSSRLAFAHLVSLIFDLPFQMTADVYGREEGWTAEYAAFIGYVGDLAVTMAMVSVSEGCCGFYSVGTLPGHRRMGYAETVMREANRQLKERQRLDSCVLQSSTAGRRLYEQMGFREVTRFSVFRSAPG